MPDREGEPARELNPPPAQPYLTLSANIQSTPRNRAKRPELPLIHSPSTGQESLITPTHIKHPHTSPTTQPSHKRVDRAQPFEPPSPVPTTDDLGGAPTTPSNFLGLTPESHTPEAEPVTMFATMRSALGGGPRAMGASPAVRAVQMELQQLKAAPILNPHFGMVNKYLDCLNRLMDAAVSSQGPGGVKIWLIEVQTLIRHLQKRVFQRMPLNQTERAAIFNFTSYWRQMNQAPFGMSRPEVQLVLITLTEFAMG